MVSMENEKNVQGTLEETVVLHFDRLEIESGEPGGSAAIDLGTRTAKRR